MKPIKPMLAQPSTGSANRRTVSLDDLAFRRGWVAEEKVDGIRALLYSDGYRNRIFNRNGREITERFPEVARTQVPACVLDGELVANDGMFQTVATRDKQTSDFASHARANPCHMVAFDLLEANGTPLLDSTLNVRTICLRGMLKRKRNIRAVRHSKKILPFYEQIKAEGGEGVILKQLSSVYLPGERTNAWVKFKTTQTITAVAVGYEAGPTREFGAINLALLDGGTPVSIGKVGTGWSESQGAALKRRLDDHELFLVEVEALNRTRDNTLRFPVWRGERTDLELTAASAAQLDLIPLY